MRKGGWLVVLLLLLAPGMVVAQTGPGIAWYPANLASSGGTLTGPLLLPSGSAAAPALGFTAQSGTGAYYAGSTFFISIAGTGYHAFTASNLQIRNDAGALYLGASTDSLLTRDGAAGVLAVKHATATSPAAFRIYSGNGGYGAVATATEEVTLSTGSATTDSTAQLLPADSYILSVTAEPTVTITTCANFSVGDDSPQTTRFISASTNITAGQASIGLRHLNPSNADNVGPVQNTAMKIRITCNAIPGAGKLRIQLHYWKPAAPTT